MTRLRFSYAYFLAFPLLTSFWILHVGSSDVSAEKNIHFFFYIWYGTPDEDGKWKHWDHEVLPHWEKEKNKNFPNIGTRHSPPQILHSPYYPLRNPYSSKHHDTLKQQFYEMNIAGGDVAVVSWWGKYDKPYATDTQGVCTDLIMHDVLKAADEYGKIKIAFHMEPYPSRSAESFRDDVKYLIDTYGHYKSIYRENGLPWFYVYDSYHIFPSQWRRVLNPNGDLTVRGTAYDGVFIGLWLEQSHGRDMQEGGFDGIYTYFATDGFSYGSTSKNWKSMCSYCRSNQMRCVLSVGPGYNDTLIRPWNSKATRDRSNGEYYTNMFKNAIAANPTQISITSFNEWGEGTQIEPAREIASEEGMNRDYLDYGERGPYMYLHLTAKYAKKFSKGGSAPLPPTSKKYSTASLLSASDTTVTESTNSPGNNSNQMISSSSDKSNPSLVEDILTTNAIVLVETNDTQTSRRANRKRKKSDSVQPSSEKNPQKETESPSTTASTDTVSSPSTTRPTASTTTATTPLSVEITNLPIKDSSTSPSELITKDNYPPHVPTTVIEQKPQVAPVSAPVSAPVEEKNSDALNTMDRVPTSVIEIVNLKPTTTTNLMKPKNRWSRLFNTNNNDENDGPLKADL